MGLQDTPGGNRLHIGIYGRRNAGKSSLINALTGQDLAIVSQRPGTTTDPVSKAMELHPIGPVVLIDTAGFDDEGELGQLRTAKTEEMTERTDVAVIVVDAVELAGGGDPEPERSWAAKFHERKIPCIIALNKWDLLNARGRAEADRIAMRSGQRKQTDQTGRPGQTDPQPEILHISASRGEGIDALRKAIFDAVPEEFLRERIIGDLLPDGGLALLVMPQDIQAPKGRLILPQVQTIRELLDKRCIVTSVTADGFEAALSQLRRAPDLIITDSQCFGQVYAKKPEESALTSFSILLAASKGDISVFVDGAKAIDDLIEKQRLPGAASANPGTPPAEAGAPVRVLIAEACTHVPLTEDIGTVKIPRLLRKTFGDRAEITGVRGGDFPDPETLKGYDLIIHCGACMFNRRLVMSRIEAARKAGVPITNYGIFLAKMNGILDKVQF